VRSSLRAIAFCAVGALLGLVLMWCIGAFGPIEIGFDTGWLLLEGSLVVGAILGFWLHWKTAKSK
jgi:hypothetical protein